MTGLINIIILIAFALAFYGGLRMYDCYCAAVGEEYEGAEPELMLMVAVVTFDFFIWLIGRGVVS